MWSVLPCIDQGRLLTEEANVLAKKKSGAVDFFRMGLLSRGVVLVNRGSLSTGRYGMVATGGILCHFN